jgi:hypothetical protein
VTARRRRDDAGSLPLAMLLSMVTLSLTVLLTTTSLRIVGATRVETGRDAALQAAQTGLASALANIRAAKDADGNGLPGNLPCAGAGVPQVTGTLTGSASRYETTVTYLMQDPTGHNQAWISARGAPCATKLPGLATYAFISSVGHDRARAYQRTLFGTYLFKTIMKGNQPGGQIRMWQNAGDRYLLCVDAGAAPAAGTPVTMQPCATQPDGTAVDRQKFAYEPNITIALTTANPVAYPNGLCLDAGSPQQAGAPVRLQPCGNPTLPQQQWSFDFASGMIGTDDGKQINNNCLSVDQPDTPGSNIKINDKSGGLGNGNPACDTNYPNDVQSWNPQPAVGAGGAVLPVTRQVVNYGQFGRCLDVTLEDVTIPYDIVFPCKQAPDPTDRDWNQQWNLPDGVGQITNDTPSGRYCLTQLPAGSSPRYIRVTPCQPWATGDTITWRVRGKDTQTYDERYRVEGTGAYQGYCLTVFPDDAWGQQGAKVGIAACSGDRLQKWNAEPDANPSGLTNIGEK